MAILLLEREGRTREFTDEVVNRPDVKAMIEESTTACIPKPKPRATKR